MPTKKKPKSSFKKSVKSTKKLEQFAKTMNTVEAVKMVSLYVLRNQGWGAKRLQEFSDKWNEALLDIGDRWYSLNDIVDVIQDETGLTLDDIKVPFDMSPRKSGK